MTTILTCSTAAAGSPSPATTRSTEPPPPPVARDFLDAAIHAARRRTRLGRILTITILSLLMLALVAGSLATAQWRRAVNQTQLADEQRRIATDGQLRAVARQLAAEASEAVARDPRTALR